MAYQTPPQHRVMTARTLSLHGKQVGRVCFQKVFSQANQMTNHLTRRVETRQSIHSLKSQKKAKPKTIEAQLLQCLELVSRNYFESRVELTLTNTPHNTHRSTCLSSCSLHSWWGFVLARTKPNVRGMCRGGCSSGAKSIRYSCFNQRTVRGSRLHGTTRSMFDTTRQWNCKLDSLRLRRATWDRRREMCGCCQAHSN